MQETIDFFTNYQGKLPVLNIAPGVKVIKPKTFVQSHIKALKTEHGKPSYWLYLQRLNTYKNLIQKQDK